MDPYRSRISRIGEKAVGIGGYVLGVGIGVILFEYTPLGRRLEPGNSDLHVGAQLVYSGAVALFFLAK